MMERIKFFFFFLNKFLFLALGKVLNCVHIVRQSNLSRWQINVLTLSVKNKDLLFFKYLNFIGTPNTPKTAPKSHFKLFIKI